MQRGSGYSAGGELDLAEELIDSDPRRAVAVAERHFSSTDPAVAFRARRIAALAAREAHDIEASTRHFRAALELAPQQGNEAALVLLSLAGNHALAGRFSEAHDVLDQVESMGALGDDQHLVAIQRASIFHIEDRLADAVAVFESMLAGDTELKPSLKAHVLGNLGSALMQLGRFAEGRDALERALETYAATGQTRPQLDVLSNLALCEAWAHHIPNALALFARARELASSLGVDDGIARLDEARALVESGLGREALEAADAAIGRFSEGGTAAWLGEAHLVRALALLLLDDPAGANEAATSARAEFDRQGRPESALLAEKTAWMAAIAEPGFADYDTALEVAGALDRAGYRIEAQELCVKVATLAFARGLADVADRAAATAAAGPSSTPATQVRASMAKATLLLMDDAVDAALQELDRGAAVLDDHRLTLGATELRARSSRIGSDMANLALRACFDKGDVAAIWSWSERIRANTLDLHPDPATQSPEIVAALATLRQVAAAARTGGSQEAVETQQRRISALLRAQASPAAKPSTGVTPPLRSTTFIEFDGWLHRIDVDDTGGQHLEARIGPTEAVARLLGSARTTWHRWLRHRAKASAVSVLSALRSVLADLDDLLGVQPTEVPSLLVVSDSLHGTPWSALPSFSHATCAVAPTASVVTRPRSSHGEGAVVIAGPGLEYADTEAAAVSTRWPDVVVHDSERSSAETVLATMSGHQVVHFAAHGTFRPDNPMFSSIELGDGPLTVIDLERLEDPPAVAVLSACDAGLPTVLQGNETLGFVAALLSVGCESVIAPVLPVSDADSTAVMAELHQHLSAGAAPTVALQQAIARFEPDSAEAQIAASFVCFGRP